MARRNSNFSLAVKTEGGLLPTDFLLNLSSLSKEIDGLEPEQYHLSEREKINEAINRAYSRLQGFWLSFKDALEKLPPEDYATSATKEKWLLPLFDCLGYGRLVSAEPITVGERQYKPSHIREHVPIHLVGYRVDLDKRSTAGGARTSSPHSLVQELLNQSDDHLWAFVSNGRKLRILRDNVSLTRQAFIEFDLESIFEGDGYSDFRLLWLLCHQSRLEGTPPEGCWLEKWKDAAQRTGVRVRDQLRQGVEKALETFGTGFLRHRANVRLRDKVKSGEVTAEEYYRQLLRLIYRLLFLFVTEDRDVLLRTDASAVERKTYYDFYSTTRLRAVAGKRRGTLHEDLWTNLSLVFEKLSSDGGCPEIGLPALGSFLWSKEAIPVFDDCRLYNSDLLDGFRWLCFTIESGIRRPVQYGQLQSEELGSIYESLLEQIPYLNAAGELPSFSLRQTAGSERKTTGSYYTPTSLVNCLLDSALEPVLDRAAKLHNAEEAILNLKVCDPACGSGHFLIAAAHRIAKRLASVRSGDLEPGPEYTSKALRDVISRCVYGVDANELAVELCKVSLWLQSTMPGIPLSFLEHKIRCGNSLLGTTLALAESGLPDEAFEAIEGDDKEITKRVKAANKQQTDAHAIPGFLKYGKGLAEMGREIAELDLSPDLEILELHAKERQYASIISSEAHAHQRYIHDAWCAAFVWRMMDKAPSPVTREVFGRLRFDYRSVLPETLSEIDRLRDEYKFFHWQLEFPQVFIESQLQQSERKHLSVLKGGFDVVLGNPPWDKIQPEEQNFFASRDPDIAEASGAVRKRMIEQLASKNVHLYSQWMGHKRTVSGQSLFIRKSGAYSLSNEGKLNTYSIFTERAWQILDAAGRLGMIVQSGLATDDSNKKLFSELVSSGSLISLFDFENKEGMFPAVHKEQRFCLITVLGGARTAGDLTSFMFWLKKTEDLNDEEKRFELTPEEFSKMSPNTGACPTFTSRTEADLVKKIYRSSVVIRNERAIEFGWPIRAVQFINLTSDSGKFIAASKILQPGQVREPVVPVYEGKYTQIYDHRFASFGDCNGDLLDGDSPRELSDDEHLDPNTVVLPRHFMSEADFKDFAKSLNNWDYKWFACFHDVANPNNERTAIFSIVPYCAVGNSIPILTGNVTAREMACFVGLGNSVVFDFVARRRIGNRHLNFFILYQLPVPQKNRLQKPCPWDEKQSLEEWLVPRVVELSYTANDVSQFAIDCGYEGKPFEWDPERRFELQCELDASAFVLYGLDRAEVESVLLSFDTLKRREEKTIGEFRTMVRILYHYDKLADKRNFAAASI